MSAITSRCVGSGKGDASWNLSVERTLVLRIFVYRRIYLYTLECIIIIEDNVHQRLPLEKDEHKWETKTMDGPMLTTCKTDAVTAF